MKPVLTPTVIGVGIVSGLFWALGQANQLKSIDLMGVSRTMPISTGLQLVATTLFGVIVFHEWSTTISVVLGVLALVCIIIGVILTSLQSKEEKNAEQAGNFKKGAFRIGYADAEHMEKEFGKIFPATALADLDRYEAAVKLLEDGTNTTPFRAKMLPPVRNGIGRRDMLIARSRERFATPRAVVEEKLNRWMA